MINSLKDSWTLFLQLVLGYELEILEIRFTGLSGLPGLETGIGEKAAEDLGYTLRLEDGGHGWENRGCW